MVDRQEEEQNQVDGDVGVDVLTEQVQQVDEHVDDDAEVESNQSGAALFNKFDDSPDSEEAYPDELPVVLVEETQDKGDESQGNEATDNSKSKYLG